jgi:hypothetical protein
MAGTPLPGVPALAMNPRHPVWLALSDLFLDTDTRLSFPYIARTLAASPFTDDELEAIFQNEVAPAVEFNLFDIAGEWAGFGEEWLIATINRRGPKPYQLRSPGTHHEFQAALGLAHHLRRIPEDARPARLEAWRLLAKLYLNRECPPPPELTSLPYSPAELTTLFRLEVEPAYRPFAASYRRHAPSLYPSPEEVEANWSAWLFAIE